MDSWLQQFIALMLALAAATGSSATNGHMPDHPSIVAPASPPAYAPLPERTPVFAPTRASASPACAPADCHPTYQQPSQPTRAPASPARAPVALPTRVVLTRAPTPRPAASSLEIKGVLQSIRGNMIVVNGIAITFGPATRVQGKLRPGTPVEVQVVRQANGTLLANEIKVVATTPANDSANQRNRSDSGALRDNSRDDSRSDDWNDSSRDDSRRDDRDDRSRDDSRSDDWNDSSRDDSRRDDRDDRSRDDNRRGSSDRSDDSHDDDDDDD